MMENKLPARDKALIAECDHVIRKCDSLLADMRKFYKEMGMEWPSSERTPNEMSEIN